MALNNIDLDNVSLDYVSLNNEDPGTIIPVRLIVWCDSYKQRKAWKK